MRCDGVQSEDQRGHSNACVTAMTGYTAVSRPRMPSTRVATPRLLIGGAITRCLAVADHSQAFSPVPSSATTHDPLQHWPLKLHGSSGFLQQPMSGLQPSPGSQQVPVQQNWLSPHGAPLLRRLIQLPSPSQMASMQGLLSEEQAVPRRAFASAGQAVEVPVQNSATSQGPAAGRQTVEAGAGA